MTTTSVAYLRCSTATQDYSRQKANLEAIALRMGWTLRRTFAEKISGTTKADDRKEFRAMLDYIKANNIKLVMVSEISRLGRRVVDVLNQIETLHQLGVSLYVQQFNMCSLNKDGTENPTVKLLMQMMSIGAEMENNLRKERQLQGIRIAQVKGVYQGRQKGSIASKESTLKKYDDVVKLLKSSKLSLSEISGITKRSINTVRRVKSYVES